MDFKKLAIAASVMACFAAPMSAQAEGASLNGWGQAFAAAHMNSGSSQASGSGEASGAISLSMVKTPEQQSAPEMSDETSAAEQPEMADNSGSEETAAMDDEMPEAPEAQEPADEEDTQEVATQGSDTAEAEGEGVSASATTTLEASLELGGSNSDAAAQAIDGAYAAANEVIDGVADEAKLTTVAINTAAIIWLADKAPDLRTATEMAMSALSEKRVRAKLDEIIAAVERCR